MQLIIHSLDDLDHILQKQQDFQALTFHGNLLAQDDRRLVDLLGQCSCLNTLVLTHHNLQRLIDADFLSILGNMTMLEHLNISKNLLTYDAIRNLFVFFSKRDKSLQSLSLNQPFFTETYIDPLFQMTGRMFCKNLSIAQYPLDLKVDYSLELDRIHIGSQFFRGQDLDWRVDEFSKHFIIQHLQCSGSDFSHGHRAYSSPLWSELKSLIARMIQMPMVMASQWLRALSDAPLLSLCLSNNYWVSVPGVLEHFQIKDFISLDLSFCRLDWESFEPFLKKQPPYFVELSLQGNQSLNKNFQFLLKYLSEHPFLCSLSLSDIPISGNDVDDLIDFLEMKSTIMHLELRGSGISLESAHKLFEYFVQNPFLVNLDIEDNALPAYFLISLWENKKKKIEIFSEYCEQYSQYGWISVQEDSAKQKILHSLLFSFDIEIEKIYPFSLRYRYLSDLNAQQADYPYDKIIRYLQHLDDRMALVRKHKFGYQTFIKNEFAI